MAKFFTKLKTGLTKTRSNLVDGIAKAMTGKTRVDESILEIIEEKLIEADLGVAATLEVTEVLRKRIKVNDSQDFAAVMAIIKEDLIARFNDGITVGAPTDALDKKPYIILVTGVNGVGKTTSIGKIANMYTKAGKKVIIGAADTFRAAASEQLEIWAQRAHADIVRTQHGADPASVAFDTVAAAEKRNADVAIIDTAGRLHTRGNLMEELRKIHRVIQKSNPEAPHESLLVLDATTGQNGLNQAQQFHQAIGLTGIVLTKLDGTAKGGIVFSIKEKLGLPVKYIGVGEQIDDLQPFNSVEYVEALLA
ncbi:MAG: signal recognition particle-docking protein FtsY [Deferribacteres bacterium]|nr:signal recognition particle-docking protein FtsY [Deferribacteres bacterium]